MEVTGIHVGSTANIDNLHQAAHSSYSSDVLRSRDNFHWYNLGLMGWEPSSQ